VRTYKRSTTIGKIKIIELTDKERLQLKEATVINHLKPYSIVNEAGKLQIPVIDREK
jgi:hypothetical protein